MLFPFLALVIVLLVLGPLVFLAMRTYSRLDLVLQGPWFKFAIRGESEANSKNPASHQEQ